jgi:hypothetical protein
MSPACVRPGMSQIGIRASVFNTEPEWAEKVELKKNVTEDLIRSGQISVVERPWKKVTTTGQKWGKAPISVGEFMRKWRNSVK